uniref:NADH dehydrogenase subunit 6 n=1 Tax=Uronema marinum TaxID=35107 RepID=A0A345WJT5_UROMR|nr:NADH dehydrogenase subunit 6 [Uronema marinum]AXJ93328.1 NADH dehydrogenase subunit 6 [Uronema marinum]
MFNFFLNYFIDSINYWWPWLSFFSDTWLVQLLLVYVLYLIFSTLNIYYILLYLFVEIFLFGIFISIIQMELFTGFLWVVECTVIFIALLLLFYLNVEGTQLRFNLKSYRINFSFFLFFLFLISNNYLFLGNYEFYLPVIFNNIDLWDDFYESLYNVNMNDFRALTVGYYSINSIEFLMVGFILLVGSLVCVNLNKLQKSMKIFKYSIYFNMFDYFKDFINFTFMRKQNLVDQNNTPSSVRIFKKK